MDLENKILLGLERISESFKALIWEKAKVLGISPIQIQILLFISSHKTELCNITYLAKEFIITKATISDAVKLLINKNYLAKDFSLIDKRRYNLLLTDNGRKIVDQLSGYAIPISKELSGFSKDELSNIYNSIIKLIYQLNQRGVIQVQRTCFNCKFYSGNKTNSHYCKLLKSKLKKTDIRLDCNEFEDRDKN